MALSDLLREMKNNQIKDARIFSKPIANLKFLQNIFGNAQHFQVQVIGNSSGETPNLKLVFLLSFDQLSAQQSTE